MRQTFIMFFFRDSAQANAGPSEVKDTGRAPGEKRGGTDRVRDDRILWVEAMSVHCRVVCNMRVSKWMKAVFQKS